MPPVEKTAPRVVGKPADSFVQPAVVVVGILGIGDRRDAQHRPMIAVDLVREGESRFGLARRQGTREILHDGVVVTVADEHDGEGPEQLDEKAPRPSLGQIGAAESASVSTMSRGRSRHPWT